MKAIYLLTRVFVDSEGNLIEGLEETLDVVQDKNVIRMAEDNHVDYIVHKSQEPSIKVLARKGWEDNKRRSIRPTVPSMPVIRKSLQNLKG